MGKRHKRERRRLKALEKSTGQNHETADPILRLVRSEDENLQGEPVTPGCSSEAVSGVQEPEGSGGVDREAASADTLAPASEDGGDELPELITRRFDATEINAILNHPSVFPMVSLPGIERFDLTPLLQDPRNVCLMADGGGIIFCWHEPGIYEVHTSFLETHRGRNALKASLAAYRWMFTHTDCMTLLTRVPSNNPSAENFCKIVGATREFERKAAWPTNEGRVDISFWSLRYDDWVRKTPSLKKSGHLFHGRLTEEYKRLGRIEEIHPEEDCHDLHVGACAEMIYGGQMDKAVILYNRWARFSCYGLISLIAHNPPMIDIGEAVLQITDKNFKVILCR